jgi:methionyl-tRNA formyltransferase
VAAAILAGDEVTGVTIMLLDEGMDTGPILAQRQISISAEDTTGSLTMKLAEEGARLLMDTLPPWLEGRLVPQPQQEEKATYSRMVSKEEGEVDWSLSAVELWRRVRAFHPWPGCYTWWKGRRLKILRAVPLPLELDKSPGRVVALEKSSGAEAGVQTGEGVLGLLQVQLEGKRALEIAEFLRGQRDFLGARLPT